MPLPIPKFIKTAFANIGLRNNIPEITNNTTGAAGYDRGFGEINMLPEGAGGIPPDGKDFNGVFYDLSAAIQYAQSGVAFPFNQNFATAIGGYEIGAIVSDASDKSLMWVNGTASNVAFPAGWTSFKASDPSQTVRGMPLVASQAEVNSGANMSKMVVPETIKMVMGPGQSWKSPSRALGVTYTNTTSRPILVAVDATANARASNTPLVFSLDTRHAFMSRQDSGNLNGCCVLVPPGSSYSVVGGLYTLATWREYR